MKQTWRARTGVVLVGAVSLALAGGVIVRKPGTNEPYGLIGG